MSQLCLPLRGPTCTGCQCLPIAAQADVRRRLFRCGLAACLNHALRLLYSAHDSGQEYVATAVIHLEVRIGPVLVSDVAPTALAKANDSSGGDGGSSSSSSSSSSSAPGRESGGGGGACNVSCGGGEGRSTHGEGRPQLGLLLTSSKRAALLSQALERPPLSTAAAGRGPGSMQGAQAAWGLAVLVFAAEVLVREIRDRLCTARQAAAVADRPDADAAAWGLDALCIDEAHEALALAARGACNLAVLWRVAEDVAALGDVTSATDTLSLLLVPLPATGPRAAAGVPATPPAGGGLHADGGAANREREGVPRDAEFGRGSCAVVGQYLVRAAQDLAHPAAAASRTAASCSRGGGGVATAAVVVVVA